MQSPFSLFPSFGYVFFPKYKKTIVFSSTSLTYTNHLKVLSSTMASMIVILVNNIVNIFLSFKPSLPSLPAMLSYLFRIIYEWVGVFTLTSRTRYLYTCRKMNSIDYGFCSTTPSVIGHWAKGITIMLSSDIKT